ncbi:hypothetical protein H1D32_02215 [Anaerobacillus sp. CMMVII]|uniref:hypothetical protein n=1 Tax=Anaerobacillus sp. CMMVII TaxID=2755588 RepID=UPI0021B78693|nr:hypothetical protein [Anaerobacillus sp. CMMVII]MCT8136666.1 hypothetical protein [Anaerobacillus sp. CMMVII]
MAYKMTMLFFFILLLGSTSVSSQSNKAVEIFDVKKAQVIKIVQPNDTIQTEVEKYIKEIDGVYKKFDPLPKDGFMFRIPLEPSIQVENKWMSALIDETIIIIPEGRKPYLLIFNDENNSYFFTFPSEIDTLLQALDFTL